jgi:hypothetical protein
MGRFVFGTLWTALTLALLLATYDQMRGWERAVLALFPAFGAFFMWGSWRDLRRRRSLRTNVENGITIYFWIELDGRERRSSRDPRPDWDAADGDGDGGD